MVQKVVAYPKRTSMRNLFVGLGLMLLMITLALLFFHHVTNETSQRSDLLKKVAYLEASLKDHEVSNGHVNKGDLPSIADAIQSHIIESHKSEEDHGMEHQTMSKDMNQIQQSHEAMQKKIDYLQDLMERHSDHHKEFIDPHLHTHEQQHLQLPSRGGDASHPSEKHILPPPSTNNRLRGSNTDGGVSMQQVSMKSSTITSSSSSSTTIGIMKSNVNIAPDFYTTTAVLIMASRRPQYLERCLDKIVKYHPLQGLPIIVSEDGKDSTVVEVVNKAKMSLMTRSGSEHSPMIHIHHIVSAEERKKYQDGYWALAAHFKWALNQVFHFPTSGTVALQQELSKISSQIKRVIIVEEDLDIAVDFYEYFASTSHLLDTDDSLLAVSAWNDNGQERNVRDNTFIYRSDFFPGLGWMLTSQIWSELEPKWPKGYWDDWLREPSQRKNRHILHPEVSRTLHYGSHGVSNGQYQGDFMSKIRLNDVDTKFRELDLSYLEKAKWDRFYTTQVKQAQLTTQGMLDRERLRDKAGSMHELRPNAKETQAYQIVYKNEREFERLAKWAGVMDNIKAHVPRTAYKGIVTTWFGNAKLHLVPEKF